MDLRELIVGSGLEADGLPEVEITDLAYRSQSVTPGALFFCVPGSRADGHDYAGEAVERGAVALVCERPLELGVAQVEVDDARSAMAPVAACFFDEPSTELDVIGVTGTNGKTTTVFLIRHLLEHAGRQTGLLGTVVSIVGGREQEVERTTPEAIDLQRTLRAMCDAGDVACVMEVSSHALELHRAGAIDFDCGVFTNLTQDHLDFHGTLDEYFGAKRRLFVPHVGVHPRTAVVNLDDEWGRKLAAELAEIGQTRLVTYAVDNDADYRADRVRSHPTGSSFECTTPECRLSVEFPLTGRFNVYNCMAAIAACSGLGIEADVIAEALASVPTVPGRFEPIDEGQRFCVLVDYAHSPDSLEHALVSARELAGDDSARVICVFGAGGDRDRGKRPLMGRNACRLADELIVTSDNPRSEQPEAIISEIVAGTEGVTGAGRIDVEPDRRAAIELAVRRARDGDVVLIAGKGHEQGQEFADGRVLPFDDRVVAREALGGASG